jgi:hypothetical protein
MLLRREPFLDASAAIKHLAAEMRARRPDAERIPPIDRAWVSPQFGGQFFLR